MKPCATHDENEWYERERAAFIAWWESEGEKKFGETPTIAAGAGWLARAEAASTASETVTPATLREDLEEIIGSAKNALGRTETEGNAQLNRGTLARIQNVAEVAVRDFSTLSATRLKVHVDVKDATQSDDKWEHFDHAYQQACNSSDPKDWQHAAMLAQQVRRATLSAMGERESTLESCALHCSLKADYYRGLDEYGRADALESAACHFRALKQPRYVEEKS